MASRLFVGGLAYAVTSDQLKDLFAQYGNVESAQVIVDRASKRSKGFGFVEMSTDDEAQQVIKELNGKDFEGRSIVVNEARPRQDNPDRGFGGDNGGYRDRNR
jgi:RNA recognition motif-containing protein